MSGSQGYESLQASDDWVEAAGNLALQLVLAPPPSDKDLWPAHYNLLMLSRAQYTSELSYKRFRAYTFDEGSSVSVESHLDRIERILRGYLEVHSFLVSAHLYWQSLKAVNDYLAVPEELNRAVVDSEDMANQTATARHHAEHGIERIQKGRIRKHSHGRPEMSAEIFRRAMGHIEGTTVVFGDEKFDLSVIYEAIRAIGKEVAPRVKEAIPLPTLTVMQHPLADEATENDEEGSQ